MSYLRFEKALMTNLQDSLPKELLRTNRSGAYSCSTIVDCNIRKYHGLLVVPVPELDDENRFKALYERYLGLMKRYADEHEAVNKSYAEAKEWLVSDEFWKQYLEIE